MVDLEPMLTRCEGPGVSMECSDAMGTPIKGCVHCLTASFHCSIFILSVLLFSQLFPHTDTSALAQTVAPLTPHTHTSLIPSLRTVSRGVTCTAFLNTLQPSKVWSLPQHHGVVTCMVLFECCTLSLTPLALWYSSSGTINSHSHCANISVLY